MTAGSCLRLRWTSHADQHQVGLVTAAVCMSADQPSTAVSAPCNTHKHTTCIHFNDQFPHKLNCSIPSRNLTLLAHHQEGHQAYRSTLRQSQEGFQWLPCKFGQCTRVKLFYLVPGTST